ncbi:TolC family protein, partial [Camelimonas abortus]
AAPGAGRALAGMLALVLAGCATDALQQVPASPAQPLTPAQGGAPQTGAGAGKSFAVAPDYAAADMDAAPQIPSGKPLGLPELIDIAQSNNPATRLAWLQARQAALSQGLVEATFLPLISANVVGGRQRVGVGLQDNPLPGALRDPAVTVGGVTPAVSLQWLLFDFGQRGALREAARHNSVAANVLFSGAHQKIIFDVTRAYFLYGAARSRTRIAAQTLANAREIESAAEARMASGLGNAVELAQAKQLAAQARFGLVQAQGNESAAYQALLTAMGVSPTARLNIRDASGRALAGSFEAPTEQAIREALARRPDVLASYRAMQAARAGVKAAQSEFMPKVFLSAVAAHGTSSLSTTGLPTVGQQGSTTGFLIGATMPLYDGGLRAAQLRKAEALADSSETVFRRVRADAVREIIVAADTLRSALASYRAARELAKAADTTWRAAAAAYKAGTGSITAVAAADSGLLAARQAEADAHAASLVAAASLAFVLGAMNSADVASGLLAR